MPEAHKPVTTVLFWDIDGTSGAEPFRLTNGFRMEIGGP